MPRIRRWFPVNHDINSDPEVVELTDRFGLAGLKVWLEILSISDRHEGYISGDYEAVVRSLSIKCNTTQRHVRGILEVIKRHRWVVDDMPMRVRNYTEYHRTRGTKKAPPSHPSEPSEPHKLKAVKKQPLSDDFLLPDWMPKSEWQEFVALRKRKHAPLTESIAKRVIAVLRELMELGHPPAEVLTEAVDRNWTGIKTEWVHGVDGFQHHGDLSERTQRILKRGL